MAFRRVSSRDKVAYTVRRFGLFLDGWWRSRNAWTMTKRHARGTNGWRVPFGLLLRLSLEDGCIRFGLGHLLGWRVGVSRSERVCMLWHACRRFVSDTLMRGRGEPARIRTNLTLRAMRLHLRLEVTCQAAFFMRLSRRQFLHGRGRRVVLVGQHSKVLFVAMRLLIGIAIIASGRNIAQSFISVVSMLGIGGKWHGSTVSAV